MSARTKLYGTPITRSNRRRPNPSAGGKCVGERAIDSSWPSLRWKTRREKEDHAIQGGFAAKDETQKSQ